MLPLGMVLDPLIDILGEELRKREPLLLVFTAERDTRPTQTAYNAVVEERDGDDDWNRFEGKYSDWARQAVVEDRWFD